MWKSSRRVSRRDLLTYLGATSEDRARLIGDLVWRNPAMADFLVDLEADDNLRTRVEIELPRALEASGLRLLRIGPVAAAEDGSQESLEPQGAVAESGHEPEERRQ
jgi:hypothetical protein